MFFQGTLQEGISTALQQTKQVVCFVTDEGDESQQWENEFLLDDAVKVPIETRSVALRLLSGSEEAGYLEALFPVPRKPTLVVIQNGQLRDYIAAGTSKEEVTRRLSLALGGPSAQPPVAAPVSATGPQSNMSDRPAQTTSVQDPPVDDGNDDLYGDAGPSSTGPPPSQPIASLSQPSSSQPPAPAAQASGQSARIQALLAERAARLETERKSKEAAAKAEAEARAKERREANPANESQSSNINPAETSYANMLRKKKAEAKEERQRILRRIEDDKRERREREARERQARLLLSATTDADVNTFGSAGQAMPLPARGGGAQCNLQVRLFDGSTIRSRFPSDVTLGTEVREWIDESRTDSDDPYTFRVVLTPLPNKVIESSEEAETLLDLSLAPSSTLVLVPRVRVATAFQQTGGLLYRGWVYIYAWIAMVLRLPRMFPGSGQGRGQQRESEGAEEAPLEDLDGSGSARQRIRGFGNPDDRRRDQQLYNGNSLNFEPRRDDEEGEN
ncbi:hypothetical protein BJ170DRAFT_597902 [Xylariales sp. AK1849]|nr:hypothetical protein BJ170DRAFT_597902 [Xylariales sp. AK1849]